VALRVAVLASGRGSNLLAILERIRAGDVEAQVTLVAGDRPEAKVLEAAARAKVPAVAAVPPEPNETAAGYDLRLTSLVAADKPDLVVLAGFMRIVGPAMMAAFPNRIVNVHPSLLPSFRGLRAVRQAVDGGARVAGCTTHIVTPDLDGGPIILQAAIPVRPDEMEEHLARRILALEHLVLPRTVQLYAERRIQTEGKRAHIKPGASWLGRPGIPFVSGALYSEGF
jgi:phosphoribosylglycinamide formyltransferase-1